jgi:aromatic ring-opening dioxygenase catalytic subunit (LigB family)
MIKPRACERVKPVCVATTSSKRALERFTTIALGFGTVGAIPRVTRFVHAAEPTGKGPVLLADVTSRTWRMPTYYIPHGGGPWPFMPERAAALTGLAAFLRGLLADVGTTPRAILVISGHWEEPTPTVSRRDDHAMLYDYYGFPPETYELDYPAPGSIEVADRVRDVLAAAGFPVATDRERGYDHGVFVPFMLVAPDGTIPVVPLSLVAGLDPAQHLAIGRALAPLRDEGILIVGSGMSFHNLRALFSGADLSQADAFDTWLGEAVTADAAERAARLTAWESAPAARFAHPREEHLLPLMVAAGAAEDDPGTRVYRENVMGATTSGFRFG